MPWLYDGPLRSLRERTNRELERLPLSTEVLAARSNGSLNLFLLWIDTFSCRSLLYGRYCALSSVKSVRPRHPEAEMVSPFDIQCHLPTRQWVKLTG